MSGALEESRVPDSGFVSGPQAEDEAVQETRTGCETRRRQRGSEKQSFSSEMDLLSVSEVLEASGLRPIFSSDCTEGPASGSGLSSDDSEASEYAPEALPPITFNAFLGSGKTAVSISPDGESTINLQVAQQDLEAVIELLRRRNRVLNVQIT